MAQKRYNGLTNVVGAALTATATTITFQSAPKIAGGAALPTLASGDYIRLAIIDSNKAVSEIVWMTAYTTGATTGTISRGQEGTTGVLHSVGDKIVHGVAAAELTSIESKLKFRGEWAGAGQLLYAQDFSGSSTMPAEFSMTGDYGGPSFTRKAMSSAIGTNQPNYAYVGEWAGRANQQTTLDFSKISALTGMNITRLVSRQAWNGQASGAASTLTIVVDGTTQATYDYLTTAWQTFDKSISMTPTTKVVWNGHYQYDGYPVVDVTGIEIYGTDPNLSYLMDEYVTYKGRLWRSTTNGNATTPGSDSSWVAVPAGGAGINPQTGTTYTLVLSDVDQTVTFNNAAATTLTIPANATTAFLIGAKVVIINIGAGAVSVAGAAGVTVNVPATGSLNRAQYERGVLTKIGTDTWVLN